MQFGSRITILPKENNSMKKRTLATAKNSLKKSISKKFSKYVIEYCDNTSIHGIHYIGGTGKARYERVIWVIIFCISLVAVGALIRQTYFKWKSSMILIGTAQRPISVWDIPFPAVTFCSETKFRKSLFNLSNIRKIYKNAESSVHSDDPLNKIPNIKLVCPTGLEELIIDKNFASANDMEYLKAVAPKSSVLLQACIWRNTFRPCLKLFKKIFTVEGVCYTFNVLAQAQLFADNVKPIEKYKNETMMTGWSIDKGYSTEFKINETYPYRDMFLAKKSSDDFGLILYLGLEEQDLDYDCGSQQGFRIYLHHPAEYPEIGQKYFFLSLKNSLHLSLQPTIMMSVDDMVSYTPEERDCYYPGEKNLALYKIYTQRNCEFECLANYTLEKCDCVPFYMPSIEGTKICGSGKSACVQLAREKNMVIRESLTYKDATLEDLLAEEFRAADTLFKFNNYDYDYSDANGNELNNDQKMKISKKKALLRQQCDCRPECNYVKYDGEETVHDFDFLQLAKAQNDRRLDNYANKQFSKLTIQYDKNKIIPQERTVFFRFVDFVASVGGLLGLFTGFSTLSAFELMYHLTLRLMCNIKNNN